jgi:hypothetical protein
MLYCQKFISTRFSVFIFLTMLLALSVTSANAYTEGPFNPASGTNVGGIGSEPWLNPGEVTQPGEPYASVMLYHLHTVSNYLQGTQYGFNIPADVMITGIEVSINRKSSEYSPSIHDSVVTLVKNGGVVGINHASDARWPTVMTVATYGGQGDLWGTDWTPAEVNSPDFGAAMAAYRDNNGNSDRYASVDSIQITVYYGYATASEVVCGDGSPVMYGESLTCVATVSRQASSITPGGEVYWTSENGLFTPNPCVLSGADGVSTCTAEYTPTSVDTGFHMIVASYAGDEYFAPSSNSTTVTVIPRPVTVTADPQTKTYGDLDPDLTYQVTQGSLVFGDTFSGALERQEGEDVGLYAILQGTLSLSENYVLTFVSDFLTILQADATCEVYPYAVVYDADPHTATGSCTGMFGEPLDGLDLSSTTHTDAGTYQDSWYFVDAVGNYNDQSGVVEDFIDKTDAVCVVTPYDVIYDGTQHTAEGMCTGVIGEMLEGLDLSGTAHTNVGAYTDQWIFTDVSGNYNDLNGTVNDDISPADPTCEVMGYTLEYDRNPHTASGSCIGVLGEPLEGLDVSGTTHIEIALYPGDPWTFTDVTGNYTDMDGTVDNEITLRFITVTADTLSKLVYKPDPSLTYQITVGSLLTGDTFTGNLVREPGERIGVYVILQGTLALPDYYQLTYVGADYTITGFTYLFPLIPVNR